MKVSELRVGNLAKMYLANGDYECTAMVQRIEKRHLYIHPVGYSSEIRFSRRTGKEVNRYATKGKKRIVPFIG